MSGIASLCGGDLKLSAETGCWHLIDFLTRDQQDQFVELARGLKTVAPMVHPTMKNGQKLSVKVSSFGKKGWWSDEKGYRYVDAHPTKRSESGKPIPWPKMPEEIWGCAVQALTAAAYFTRQQRPEFSTDEWVPGGTGPWADRIDTCLVNYYGPEAQLGPHVDQTEKDKRSPIVTVSIGATADFNIRLEHGGEPRLYRYTVRSGDVIVMAGPARLAEHSVTNIRVEEQGSLLGANYNPIRESKSRLSFTIRSTGL